MGVRRRADILGAQPSFKEGAAIAVKRRNKGLDTRAGVMGGSPSRPQARCPPGAPNMFSANDSPPVALSSL